MALTAKEQSFLLDLLKGMLSLVTVGRKSKAVDILNDQKKKRAKAKAESKPEPRTETPRKSNFNASDYRKYFADRTMSNDKIMKKLVFMSHQQGTEMRPKIQIAG